MKINKLGMQMGYIPWLGAFVVQISNGLFYVSLTSTLMVALTFWNTTGGALAHKYIPWLNLLEFLIFLGCFLIVLMMLDFKFVYPSRAGFTNEQACKAKNPAMDIMNQLVKENAALKKQIEDLRAEMINAGLLKNESDKCQKD